MIGRCADKIFTPEETIGEASVEYILRSWIEQGVSMERIVQALGNLAEDEQTTWEGQGGKRKYAAICQIQKLALRQCLSEIVKGDAW